MKIPLTLDEASLICPITGQAIQDPVVDHEGNSYEKTAILEWLSRNPTSPITRNPLSIHQLAPNRVLKALLEGQDVGGESGATAETKLPPTSPDFTVSTKIIPSDGHALLQVSVTDDESTSHKPASVICVIDVSGSMSNAATMHGDSEGSGGLSLLDIVKHATRTVIETLSPQDRLAVISYSNNATLVLPLTHMTCENKVRAWNAVDTLSPGGGTNLWSGLAEAMNIANLDNDHCNIVLLTDGQPNIHPPRGEFETLKRYKQNNPSMNASISTFGFGYCIKSKLLSDIAQEGKGHYCFIPDSSFVGTVFVNATANILSTAIPASTLVVECNTELEDLSGHNHTRELSPRPKLTFELPPLIYGQTLDILVKSIGATKPHTKGMRIILKDNKGNELSTADAGACDEVDQTALGISQARARVRSLISASEHKLSVEYSAKVFRLVQKDIQGFTLDGTSNPSIKAINDDLTGQIKEAYSRLEWHSKWGRHYLLSLIRAYALQQCTNFKDPGVQIYATKKFSLIRDASEETFCKLPPPTPSRPLTDAYVPVRSMSAYYNSATPCFASGTVTLADGRKVDISELSAGDEVESATGPVRVKCIIKTLCENHEEELVELNDGVVVTPWHPVRKLGTSKWRFPAEMAKSKGTSKCDAVYSFVLENRGSCLKIGPYEGIAMGHDITSDSVAAHPYFGTERVLDDLAEMPGWSSGLITLAPKPFLRDPKTRLIVKLRRTSSGTMQ